MRRVVNAIAAAMLLAFPLVRAHGAGPQQSQPSFHTSDRCLACHNQLITPTGQDVSIGFDWRASIMANSSRDPYWQASVRREDIDHPESKAKIEDSCADCHMPVSRFEAKEHGRLGEVFEFLPFAADPKASANAEDGVTCSVCHQISKSNFGTRQSFNGGFAIDAPVSKVNRPEYGPFDVQPGQTHIMESSTGGFRPTESAHVRQSALCATCHTLYTKTLDSQGKVVGELPEQMPYLEWQHSDYKDNVSCQSCHMPQVNEEAPIAAVLGQLRTGVRQHTFIGGNFFMLRLLNLYRDDLIVSALPPELTAQAQRTTDFLQSQAARVTLRHVDVNGSVLAADVFVENLSGHKLPTAFPSRRAWLHFVVKDGRGQTVFESGALNADGSIRGNDNDADPLRFEPHYTEITSPDEVQIYEDILRDPAGRVTTGLTAASGYAKDNRLLPSGFDKQTASKDIAVRGEAADDANFTGEGDLIRYSVSLAQAQGPFRVQAELWYQPVGFRWAHNLASYNSPETQRFVRYYDSMPSVTALMLTHTEATH